MHGSILIMPILFVEKLGLKGIGKHDGDVVDALLLAPWSHRPGPCRSGIFPRRHATEHLVPLVERANEE
jgi:hypothetical protein